MSSPWEEALLLLFSRSFFTFVQAVGGAANEREEREAVVERVRFMREHVHLQDGSESRTREYLISLLFCSLLGYDNQRNDADRLSDDSGHEDRMLSRSKTSGYAEVRGKQPDATPTAQSRDPHCNIHEFAVDFAARLAHQARSYQEKRLAYLTLSCWLEARSEMSVLMTNLLLTDLSLRTDAGYCAHRPFISGGAPNITGSGGSHETTLMEDEDDVRVKVAALSAAIHCMQAEMVPVLMNPVYRLIDLHPRYVPTTRALVMVMISSNNVSLQRFPLPTMLSFNDALFSARVRRHALALLYAMLKQNVSVPDQEFLRQCKCCLKKTLVDVNPSVMNASLDVFALLLQLERKDINYFAFVDTFVHIQSQILEERLSPSYNYHDTHAPWIQLKLIRILGRLARNQNPPAPVIEAILNILDLTLRKSREGVDVAFGITFECIRAFACIQKHLRERQNSLADSHMFKIAYSAVEPFVTSMNRTRQYLSIRMLREILPVDKELVVRFQMQIIGFLLDEEDETLPEKAIEFLLEMANKENATVLVTYVLDCLKQYPRWRRQDPARYSARIGRLLEIIRQFSPSSEWFLQATISVLHVASEDSRSNDPVLPLSYIYSIMEYMERAKASQELCALAVAEFLTKLDNLTMLSKGFVIWIVWTVGQYLYLAKERFERERAVKKIADLAFAVDADDEERLYSLDALSKNWEYVPSEEQKNITQQLEDLSKKTNVAIRIKLLEMLQGIHGKPQPVYHNIPAITSENSSKSELYEQVQATVSQFGVTAAMSTLRFQPYDAPPVPSTSVSSPPPSSPFLQRRESSYGPHERIPLLESNFSGSSVPRGASATSPNPAPSLPEREPPPVPAPVRGPWSLEGFADALLDINKASRPAARSSISSSPMTHDPVVPKEASPSPSPSPERHPPKADLAKELFRGVNRE